MIQLLHPDLNGNPFFAFEKRPDCRQAGWAWKAEIAAKKNRQEFVRLLFVK